jgi:hypothetical protein
MGYDLLPLQGEGAGSTGFYASRRESGKVELTVMALETTPEHESHDGFPHPPAPLPHAGEGSVVSRLRRLSR